MPGGLRQPFRSMLTFSVWYVAEGLGRLQSLPAFDSPAFEAAVQQAKP